MWSFETDTGTFYIVEKHGQYEVLYDHGNCDNPEDLGRWPTPDQAAEQLSVGYVDYAPSSGVKIEELGLPGDLSSWPKYL